MSKRSDALLLADMEEAVDKILRFTAGKDRVDWSTDEQLQDAVIRNFEVIGEAGRHLSHAFVAAHPGTDWAGIRDFRNLLVHEYFGVDLDIVWDIVLAEVPKLKDTLVTVRKGL